MVIAQARPWWNAARMPEDALRYYLRDDGRYQFVDSVALLDGGNLCDLRRFIANRTPVFIVIDGADKPAGGVPPEIPGRTHAIVTALERDLPESRELLRIP